MNGSSKKNVLLAGANGYVGGRLAQALALEPVNLRCMVRRPEESKGKFPSHCEVIKADVFDRESLLRALKDIDVAYYLIHSMGDERDFEALDRRAAHEFASACEESGVKRMVYLGGLGDEARELSAHLRSRQEVGKIFRASQVETIEFRASIVIGSGSLSFEMVRSLTEKLPVMITPQWVRVKTQPISIVDLLRYLVAALDLAPGVSRVVEIGGKDVVSYGELMNAYAEIRGLKRMFVPVPLLTPYLSSLWLAYITPLYARVGHKLITSLKNSTVVRMPESSKEFSITPMGIHEALHLALLNEDQEFGQTHWSDALSSLGAFKSWAGVRFGTRIVDSRETQISAPPPSVFRILEVIGGDTGWYFANWLWRVRGFIDRLVGGPGLRRGRKNASVINVGDVIDFWRVEECCKNSKLRLRAEMKVPGRAWLEFTLEDNPMGSTLRQTAIFDPVGLSGRLYWYVLFPLHSWIFRGMLSAIKKAALESQKAAR